MIVFGGIFSGVSFLVQAPFKVTHKIVHASKELAQERKVVYLDYQFNDRRKNYCKSITNFKWFWTKSPRNRLIISFFNCMLLPSNSNLWGSWLDFISPILRVYKIVWIMWTWRSQPILRWKKHISFGKIFITRVCDSLSALIYNRSGLYKEAAEDLTTALKITLHTR
jgi:hypothetical protein